jgi:hypothetical protein
MKETAYLLPINDTCIPARGTSTSAATTTTASSTSTAAAAAVAVTAVVAGAGAVQLVGPGCFNVSEGMKLLQTGISTSHDDDL